MTRPLTRMLPPLLAIGVTLCAVPAAATAGAPAAEATSTTVAQGETTTPAPAPEAPSATTSPAAPSTGEGTTGAQPVTPQVQGQVTQGATPSPARASRPGPGKGSGEAGEGGAGGGEAGTGAEAGAAGKPRALPPSTLTPALPLALSSSLAGLPAFFIESFRIPPFLLPIFQAAGTAYGIPWQVLAAINEVESDYGRDLSVSSAGAEGWMQFLPAEWAQYGLDANGDGYRDPYNPADAIFAAARYLRAAGGAKNIKAAVFAYNHSQAYVESVMLRAQLLGGTPPQLLGAITGLTEARFPVHAAAHFGDVFPTVPGGRGKPPRQVAGTTIYAQPGAPVIAVQDGQVVQIGSSPQLGHFVVLRDAFGNTYTYARLGSVASLYPVLAAHVNSTIASRISSSSEGHEAAPTGPATAGAQPRSPLSNAGTVSSLALGAAATLESAPAGGSVPGKPPVLPAPTQPRVRSFSAGGEDVFLHPLQAGVQVIAGTVLGHLGGGQPGGASEGQLVFQIRPAGAGAPLIDPKPILDGWVALEASSIFRAKGENPFLATSPTIGQVLLESKQQLERQVLRDGGIKLTSCGRQDVRAGRVDKRVLSALEYLSVSGLRPTAGGLKCTASSAGAANAAAGQSLVAVDIAAVNGVPIAGHDGAGSVGDETVRKLLQLQGLARPQRISSALSYPGTKVTQVAPGARKIRVVFARTGAVAGLAALGAGGLSPSEWVKLIARLGEIPDPTVSRAPSSASLPVSATGEQGGEGGHR
jgi:murein DD-endopeptidase MepM/ murein hydrolase activator NlpD